jgi:RNA polymerase sigma-B factor
LNTTTTDEHAATGALHHVRSDEAELWERRDIDPRAREELVRRYLPFARGLAAKYRNSYESTDDLFQVASVGLVNAVNRFDPARGAPFAAFATPTIRGELKRYFRDKVWTVRVPRGIQETIQTLESAGGDLSAELHRDPTPAELAEHSGIDEEAVREAILARSERHPVSLDLPVDEERQAPGEVHGAEDPGFRVLEETDKVRRAMETLGDTERLVMRLRFIEEMTQSEIAERVGCSQMHISRLIRRTLAKLNEQTAAD